jgi:hypothetical protein
MWNKSTRSEIISLHYKNKFLLDLEILGNILNKSAAFVKWHITLHLFTCLWNVTYLSKLYICNVHLYFNEVKAMDHCFYVSKIWHRDKTQTYVLICIMQSFYVIIIKHASALKYSSFIHSFIYSVFQRFTKVDRELVIKITIGTVQTVSRQ